MHSRIYFMIVSTFSWTLYNLTFKCLFCFQMTEWNSESDLIQDLYTLSEFRDSDNDSVEMNINLERVLEVDEDDFNDKEVVRETFSVCILL